VFAVRLRFGALGRISQTSSGTGSDHLPKAFWLYAISAALAAFGFADFTLMSFHFGKQHILSGDTIALFYALAMLADGAASLLFGRWFDRRGLGVVYGALVLGLLVAPLSFCGGYWGAILGTLIWGAALGVQESVMAAAVAAMVPLHARARAYGIFTALFGVAWFLGSALLGALYDLTLPGLVIAASLAQAAAFYPLYRAIKSIPEARKSSPAQARG
jgi:Major Facilitator Superfamily.